jgi:hypothetical protein
MIQAVDSGVVNPYNSMRLATTSATSSTTVTDTMSSASTDKPWGDSCGGVPGMFWTGLTSLVSMAWTVITLPFTALKNCFYTVPAATKTTEQQVAVLETEMTVDNVTSADLMKHFVSLTNIKAGDTEDATKVGTAVNAAAKAAHDKGGAAVNALKGAIYAAGVVAGEDVSDADYGGTQMMTNPTGDLVKNAALALYRSIPSVTREFAHNEIATKGSADVVAALRAFQALATCGANPLLDSVTTNAQLNDAKRVEFYNLPVAHQNHILAQALTGGMNRALLANDAGNNGHFGNPDFGAAVTAYVGRAFPVV